jgi:hypothetical protein
MSAHSIVSVASERLDELRPVWQTLYEHHLALTPHLRERSVQFVTELVQRVGEGAERT